MRTIRTVDPQSGITTVREITLISTAGVTFNEYEELPEKNQDVPNMANQLTEAIYDARRSLNEGNVLNYQLMQNLTKEVSNLSAAQTQSRLETAHLMNDTNLALGNAQLELNKSDKTLHNQLLEELVEEVKQIGVKSESNANVLAGSNSDAARLVSDDIRNYTSQSHTDVDSLRESVEGLNFPRSADNLQVTIGEDTMTVNQAFTEIFSLLNEIKSRLDS